MSSLKIYKYNSPAGRPCIGRNCALAQSLYVVFPFPLGQFVSVTYPSGRAGNASNFRVDHVTRNALAARKNEAQGLGNKDTTPHGLLNKRSKADFTVGNISNNNTSEGTAFLPFMVSHTMMRLSLRGRLSKRSFVGVHMARDEGLFILDWRQFYRLKNRSVRLDQSKYLPRTLGIKLSLTSAKRIET